MPDSTLPLTGWLDALARAEPDPGGGAAAAVVLAHAAALAEMTAGYAPGPEARRCADAARHVRTRALAAAERDAAASRSLVMALRISDAAAAAPAVREAIDASVHIADLATELDPLLRWLAARGVPHVMADVAVAARLRAAAVRAAAVNLRVNAAAAASSEAARARRAESAAVSAADDADALAAAVTATL